MASQPSIFGSKGEIPNLVPGGGGSTPLAFRELGGDRTERKIGNRENPTGGSSPDSLLGRSFGVTPLQGGAPICFESVLIEGAG